MDRLVERLLPWQKCQKLNRPGRGRPWAGWRTGAAPAEAGPVRDVGQPQRAGSGRGFFCCGSAWCGAEGTWEPGHPLFWLMGWWGGSAVRCIWQGILGCCGTAPLGLGSLTPVVPMLGVTGEGAMWGGGLGQHGAAGLNIVHRFVSC